MSCKVEIDIAAADDDDELLGQISISSSKKSDSNDSHIIIFSSIAFRSSVTLKFSCFNGLLLRSKLNLMIDDDVYRCGQDYLLWLFIFVALKCSSVNKHDKSFLPYSLWNVERWGERWGEAGRECVDIRHKIECTIDWFCRWGRASETESERATVEQGGADGEWNEELPWVFVLLDLKPFPMIKLCSLYIRDCSLCSKIYGRLDTCRNSLLFNVCLARK